MSGMDVRVSKDEALDKAFVLDFTSCRHLLFFFYYSSPAMALAIAISNAEYRLCVACWSVFHC